MHVCVSSKGTHLVTDSKVRCTRCTAGCNKNTHSCTLSASPMLIFLPKSTPGGGVLMCSLLWWRALCWGVSPHALLWPRLHSEHVLANNTCVCWSSCLSHLRPPLLHKERSRMLENALCLALPTCKPSRTQRQTTELRGKHGSCLFSVVVAVFVCPIVLLSLVSHAWRCLKVELRHHGGEMRRFFVFSCCGCLCWHFLLMNKIAH